MMISCFPTRCRLRWVPGASTKDTWPATGPQLAFSVQCWWDGSLPPTISTRAGGFSFAQHLQTLARAEGTFMSRRRELAACRGREPRSVGPLKVLGLFF